MTHNDLVWRCVVSSHSPGTHPWTSSCATQASGQCPWHSPQQMLSFPQQWWDTTWCLVCLYLLCIQVGLCSKMIKERWLPKEAKEIQCCGIWIGLIDSLVPWHGGERAPGIHCLHMPLIATESRGDRVCTCTYIYWWHHKLAALMCKLVLCSSELHIVLFW